MNPHDHPSSPEDTNVVGRRLIAHLLDIAVLYLLILAFAGLGAPLPAPTESGDSAEAVRTVLLLSWLAACFFYLFLLEGYWGGKTVGKWAVGIKVVRSDGSPCTYGASLGRNLLRVIDALPAVYIVGLISMAMSEQRKRVGDHLAGTIVVQNPASPDGEW